MSHDPFSVSVIIPVYNGQNYLAEAVASILRQGYEPLEIIIVDDGSTDDTAAVAAALQGDIRYIFQPNNGAPSARNQGLNTATGDIICFLDADDMWTNDKLEIQLSCLASDDSVEVVLGHMRYFRAADTGDVERSYEYFPRSWPTLGLGAASFRRSVFDKVGLLDPTLLCYEDVDWYLRAKEAGVNVLVHPEVVWLYRRHDLNITNQREWMNHYFVVALKKSLDRRRAQQGEAKPLPSWLDGGLGKTGR